MQKLRRYENIVILRPNLNEDDIGAITGRTKSVIESFGGTELRVDRWGVRKLAYDINKQRQGNYVYTEFAGLPAAVAEMERLFRIDDRVLKFMTVKIDDEYVPGSVSKPVAPPSDASVDAEPAAA